MPTATWRSYKQDTIDQVNPQASSPAPAVGVLISGASKSSKSRALLAFDFAAAPDDGTAPAAGTTITAADLLMEIDTLTGAGGWAMDIERLEPDAWIGNGHPGPANWGHYDTNLAAPLAWTNFGGVGGDVATPPALITVASPLALGSFQIGGLLAFAQDAFSTRGNHMHLRIRADNETPSVSAYFSSQRFFNDALRPRLQLTYGAASTIDERDTPSFAGVRPAFAVRPSGAHSPARPTRPARR